MVKYPYRPKRFADPLFGLTDHYPKGIYAKQYPIVMSLHPFMAGNLHDWLMRHFEYTAKNDAPIAPPR